MTARKNKSVNFIRELLHVLFNLLFYGAVILISVQLCRGVYHFSYEVFGEAAMEEAPGRDIVVFLPRGESEKETAERLQMNGVISNRHTFYLKSILLESEIQPGKYLLNTSMTYQQILDTITAEMSEKEKE